MYAPGTRAYRGAWQETIKAAEEANDPGRFTAFIGYEWTSNTGGNNLHRNVIFRDNGDKASQVEPFTMHAAARQRQSARPVEMDGGLRGEDRRQRARHRAQRQSEQRPMFPIIEAFTGKPIDREYAETAREVGAALRGHADEGRRRDASVPVAQRRVRQFRALGQGQPRRERGEEARRCSSSSMPARRSRTASSSKQKLGVNPYKFGLVGSTDAHTGLAAVEEDNFFGKTTPQEPSPDRMHRHLHEQREDRREDHGLGGRPPRATRRSGPRRTRARSLFDAMERRETYATTGRA